METLVSTRLEPGVDPILEADKRGTILLIVRVGAIDLEMPGSGGTGAPIVIAQPDAPSSQVLRHIAEKVAAQVSIRSYEAPVLEVE